jgi:hypothetical protein
MDNVTREQAEATLRLVANAVTPCASRMFVATQSP